MDYVIIDGKKYRKEIADKIFEAQENIAHYDLLQLTKKLQLNSTYGALLSAGFRWSFKEWIGASVTYTGRAITTHMINEIAYILSGTYANLKKTFSLEKTNVGFKIKNIYISDHKNIIYGDTDSNYFLTETNNKEEAIIIADEASSYVNSTFKNFMKESFFCTEGFDNIIKAGREIVASRGLFQAHKKYIAKVVNQDGFDVDKIKAMGSEIKKSDTPKVIQKFLKETVTQILDGKEYKEICEYVNDQRKKIFKEKISPKELILLGTSKSTNDYDHYEEVYYAELAGKPMKKANGKSKITVPGHIRASVNYNRLLDEFSDLASPKINNGDKVKVFQLKRNDFGFETIAFPADIVQFPKWFIEHFELDLVKSEEKLITAKLQGIFDAMGVDVPTPQSTFINSVIEF